MSGGSGSSSTSTGSGSGSSSGTGVDPLLRLMRCVGKIQEQMERLAAMQSETILAVSKLTNMSVQLSQRLEEIALTASSRSRPGQIEKTQVLDTSGADVFLSLPVVDPTDVFGPLPKRKSRVLVVEDDAAYQWLVSKLLEAQGVECVLAPTAQEGVQRVRGGSFDLVLMDMQFPSGLSGLDATRGIRAFDERTPIVSMTAAMGPRQVASYIAGGMNDVLAKPFSKEGLLTLVGKFCKLDLNGCSSTVEEVPSSTSSSSSSSETDLPSGGTLDPDTLVGAPSSTLYTFGLI